MKKYEFTEETKKIGEVTLHRIRAAVDFYIVNTDGCDADSDRPPLTKIERGTLGGWIEKEENLSQEGTAWVADEACVYGKGHVWGATVVSENATVSGGDIMDFARVYGKATVHSGCVSDHTRIYDEAEVSGGIYSDHAQVYGNATIEQEDDGELTIAGNARIYGQSKIACESGGTIEIGGNAKIYDDAKVRTWVDCGTIWVYGNAKVCGNAEIIGAAEVSDAAVVTGHTVLSGGVVLKGNARIDISDREFGGKGQRIPPRATLGEDAYITDPRDCLVISPIIGHPKNDFLTFYLTEQGSIKLSIGENGALYPLINAGLLREMLLDYEPKYADLITDAATYALSYFEYQRAAREAEAAASKQSNQP